MLNEGTLTFGYKGLNIFVGPFPTVFLFEPICSFFLINCLLISFSKSCTLFTVFCELTHQGRSLCRQQNDRNSSAKNENVVIIYCPSFCSKPVCCCCFLCNGKGLKRTLCSKTSEALWRRWDLNTFIDFACLIKFTVTS